MIKEMDTGEGLSIILRCLATNFVLKKHKVDKITNNKNFTNYKADILYITFLLFEGNILEQMKCN